MPFGIVSGVVRGMSVLDGDHDHRRGMGSFGGEFGAYHLVTDDVHIQSHDFFSKIEKKSKSRFYAYLLHRFFIQSY